MTLKTLKEQMETHLLERFKIAPEKSKVRLYRTHDWQKFCSKREIPNEALGAYFSRDLSAHLLADSELLALSFFHEYFGHGLWTEHTKSGQEHTMLEQKLLEEEISSQITPENLYAFRESNKIHKELLKLHAATLPHNEGFALWMEHYLASITGNHELFLRKFDRLNNKRKELCAKFIDYQSRFGEYALMYSNGLPKHHDNKILEEVLRKVFPAELDKARLALVYGSKEPYSDIDIFMISDEIPCSYYSWLDVYSISEKDFWQLALKLDISVTDPLFSGELVSGDKEYLEYARRRVIGTPITPYAVEHSLKSAKNAKAKANDNRDNPAKYHNALGYESSYLANAKDMLNGKKALTLKNLVAKYPEDFRETHDNKYKQ